MCYNFGASMSAASSNASTTPAAPPSSTYSGEYDGCSSSESDSEVVSLLDRLKSPAPVAIARSRKIRTDLPPHPLENERAEEHIALLTISAWYPSITVTFHSN